MGQFPRGPIFPSMPLTFRLCSLSGNRHLWFTQDCSGSHKAFVLEAASDYALLPPLQPLTNHVKACPPPSHAGFGGCRGHCENVLCSHEAFAPSGNQAQGCVLAQLLARGKNGMCSCVISEGSGSRAGVHPILAGPLQTTKVM